MSPKTHSLDFDNSDSLNNVQSKSYEPKMYSLRYTNVDTPVSNSPKLSFSFLQNVNCTGQLQ